MHDDTHPHLSAQPLGGHVLGQSRARSRRTVRTLVVAALLVVLGVALTAAGGGFSAVSPLAGRLFPTPTATEFVTPGSDEVLWLKMSSDFKVDGHVPSATNISDDKGHVYNMAHLAPGKHTITYQVGPFPAVKCTLDVPYSAAQTCPLWRTSDAPHFVGAPSGVQLVNTVPALSTLTADQTTAVNTALTSALGSLTASTTMQAGDHYADSAGNVAIAQSTRPVSLRAYALAGAPPLSLLCDNDCTAKTLVQGSTPNALAWDDALPYEQYRLTFDGNLLNLGMPVPAIDFAIHWSAGAWSAEAHADFGQLWCELAIQPVNNLKSSAGVYGGFGYSGGLTDPSDPMAGCIMQQIDASNGSTATNVLYRFGVPLALDAHGQAEYPGLVMANAHEQAIAQQILAAAGTGTPSSQP